MEAEYQTKLAFKHKVTKLIKDSGGKVRISTLIKTLRREGYHPAEILDILHGVGVHLDHITDTATLRPGPIQTSLDPLIQ